MDRWIRKTHRALSITFSVIAIANIVALVMKVQAAWLGLLALVPLIPLLLSGLYLFSVPYVAKWRGSKEPHTLPVGQHQ
jgi:hypothetical protein